MLKPKSRDKSANYWDSLSDIDLLNAELTTDSPEPLENLVRQLPAGDYESYVEYKYDLRGTEHDKLRCVHCNQPHFRGYVMNKGGERFLVGHICGAHIYGEDFNRYTNDYEVAVERRDTLRRARDARAVIQPFMIWLKAFSQSEIFDQYEKLRDQFEERMSWLYKQLSKHTNFNAGMSGIRNCLQHSLMALLTRELNFSKRPPGISADALLLVGKIELEKNLRVTFARLQAGLRTLENVIEQLKEPIDFFQPNICDPICEWATKSDNANKRRYTAGLMSITCLRDEGPATIRVPKSYAVPDLAPIIQFRAALAGLGSTN